MSPKEQKAVTVSVVIPAYNEEGNISLLMVKLEQILDDFSYEILFVDDGSSDGTLERIKALGRSKPHLHLPLPFPQLRPPECPEGGSGPRFGGLRDHYGRGPPASCPCAWLRFWVLPWP